MKISSKLAVVGCFAIMGTLVLFSPQQAQALCFNCSDTNLDPVMPYVAPPNVDRLHQWCIEEWQKSHAFTEQQCKGVDVRGLVSTRFLRCS
ncbi:MAG: hypothetical protein OXF60_11495 [Gammaproteobacteria bacterium]|nr:hypothetical protein [Gammaproteobacteria bacterium]